ncbi:hypothetical protein OROGR_032954 [Orobanche gracilis]
MQGPGSSMSALPDNLIFDNVSTLSSDTGMDNKISWNTMLIPAQNPQPESRTRPSGTHLQHVRRDLRNADWCFGETSSSAIQYQPYDILYSQNIEISRNDNRSTNSSFILQNSNSNAVHGDLNMSLEFGDQEEDDDCRIIEHPRSIGPSNRQIQSNNSPSWSYGGPACGGYVIDESGEDRLGFSLDGGRMPCKRKALDVHAGPSSGVGSSNYFQNAERRQWHAIPENDVSIPTIVENNVFINNRTGTEQANLRLRPGVGRPSSSRLSSTVSGNSESSRRNFRLRINNGLNQQDSILPESTSSPDIGNSSRLDLRNHSFDLNPHPVVETGNLLHGQSALLDVPNLHRNHQSRWSGLGSPRSSRLSAPTVISYEEPTAQRTISRWLPESPMFVPGTDMGNLSQNHTNLNLPNNIAGNAATTSRVSSSGSRRSFPQYSRRLSEIVRRSLLPSAGNDTSINHVGRSVSLAGSLVTGLPSGPDNILGRNVPGSRSVLLERHRDGAFRMPYSLRTLAGTSEGGSVMSEMASIRHVVDLMRRGEGLRLEDVMIFDHSVLFGMADTHDRHRDMRLDVDNMSYEELLALEEHIGSVCTGLSEETILSHLKQRKFFGSKEDPVETEPCSICREEYNNGEELGSLVCGHDFHRDCIKKWLTHKNLCPICKTTGLIA